MQVGIAWTFAETEVTNRLYLPAVLREWARGARIGVGLSRASIFGLELSVDEVDRLNCFIAAGGAAMASGLPYWQAVQLIGSVIGRQLDEVACVVPGLAKDHKP